MKAAIQAIEYYLPDNRVSNEDLLERFPDYDFTKFENKVGIKYRYWVKETETALDLAYEACQKLFKRVDKTNIDYVILCTQSPEYLLPTTACILQDRLGLSKRIGAFDFNLGCSGYVYGLSLAKALVESEQACNVLLITTETYSKYLHMLDKSNRAIFGDAASATLVSEGTHDGLKGFLFGTDGAGAEKLIVRNGGSRNRYDSQTILRCYGTDNFYTDNNLYMNGPEIFNFTADLIPEFTGDLLFKNNTNIENVDYFIFHQANAFMLNTLRKRLKVSAEKFYIDLEDGGNTVSNTIPIALKRLSDSLAIDRYLNIALVGFGVGLSWAGGMISIDKKL